MFIQFTAKLSPQSSFGPTVDNVILNPTAQSENVHIGCLVEEEESLAAPPVADLYGAWRRRVCLQSRAAPTSSPWRDPHRDALSNFDNFI